MNSEEFVNIARCERDLWWFRGQRRILDSVLDSSLRGRSIKNVLEAGCGTGYQSEQLASRYGWRMFPLDLDERGLGYGRSAGVQRLTQADIAQLPFPAAAFDAVVSLDVLVHFPPGSESEALQELVRVIRPGGLLILRVSALNALRSRHSMFAHERQRFTRSRLINAVSTAGVRTLRCTYANGLLLPVALFKFRVWEPLTNRPPASGVAPRPRSLDAILHAPLWLESHLLRTGLTLPLGQSLLLVGEKASASAP